MGARDDIAAAASTVAAVNCSPHYRQSTKPGDAWVQIGEATRDDSGFGFMQTWQVFVVLSQDLPSAERWIEDHAMPLAAALRAELVVLSLTPAELLVGANTTNGLIVAGTRPSE